MTEDKKSRLPTNAPVSDDKSSIDSLLLHTTTESEGDFFSVDADDGPSNSQSPYYKIPSPSQPSPPNTSQEGDQAEPKRKYQRKQWPEAVWGKGNGGKMKRVKLNKLNRQLYALTLGPQPIPPMDRKISKKRMCFNYNQYKRSLCENGDMSLQIMTVG